MAFHHNYHHLHENHHPTTQPCCCQTPPYHPPPPSLPPPPPPSSDPFLIATIVAQLLQTQNFTSISPNHNYPCREPHHSQPQHSSNSVSSLLRRVDNLETSLHQLSSSSSSSSSYPPFYLRDAAARVVQTHFRAFLVRRSRILRQLKLLANVKSNLTCLKSSFSPHGFIDYDSLSHQAMDLLLVIDAIQGEDQMIRDSKKSITREIVQFLELIDEVCVKRHQVMTRKMKSMRLVRNDNARTGHDSRRYSERAGGSKGRNVDSEEKKLIASLKERVERIGKMSKALEAEEVEDEETEGFEQEDSGAFNHIGNKYGLKKGVTVDRIVPHSDGKKRVCFVEDGNTVRVYNVDGNKVITARDVEEIEVSTKGGQDEEEAHSDEERSSQSSEDMRSRSYGFEGILNYDKEFTFPAPEPSKMEPRADSQRRNLV